MRAMVVKVGPEIEQLVFEICCRPKQRMIQILASNGADQPFHKWMGQGDVGDGLDLCHLQYSQIGLPLVEPVKRIVVGAKVLRQPVLPSNRAVEQDRKSTRLNSSHRTISYAVFCLKKKQQPSC